MLARKWENAFDTVIKNNLDKEPLSMRTNTTFSTSIWKIIPFLTVCIWGSLYIASGIVLQEMNAIVLLAIRFVVSSVLLFVIGGRTFIRIRKEDLAEFLLIGFLGYFVSNAALLLGIQHSSGSFSSLLNATNPVLITVFAVLLLKEQVKSNQILAIAISVLGAVIVIGAPSQMPSVFGVGCCLVSVLLWSYVTIHIKKLSAKYPALQVTAVCMGIAAVFSVPCAYGWLTVSDERIVLNNHLLSAIAYICIVCTALSHCMWNASLKRLGASYCASFYPMQPIISVLLGILLLNERITLPFLTGMALIIFSMLVHSGKVHLIPGRMQTVRL